jgi:hypothetical protein
MKEIKKKKKTLPIVLDIPASISKKQNSGSFRGIGSVPLLLKA